MRKSKEGTGDSSATIYIHYDAEMDQKDPGYVVRWGMWKEETQAVSRFVQNLHGNLQRRAFQA